MRAQALAASRIMFGLAGLLVLTEAAAGSPFGSTGSAQIVRSALLASAGSPQSSEQLRAVHGKCMEAGERLERSAAAMVGGRTWRWRLDSQWSREHFDELRRDLRAFWDAEAAFEASLSPEQKSKLNSQFTAIHQLFHHLDRDAQSLDDELRKGYPTRWHVENDASDIRKEIHRWRKLDQRIAEELDLKI